MPDLHRTLPLDMNGTPRLTEELVLDLLLGVKRDLNDPARAMAFHNALIHTIVLC